MFSVRARTQICIACFLAFASRLLVALPIVGLICAAVAAQNFGQRELNTALSGTALRNFTPANALPDLCRDSCAADPQCVGYMYVHPGAFRADSPPQCYLFASFTHREANTCCASGVKGAQAPIAGPSATPSPPPQHAPAAPLDLAGGRDGVTLNGASYQGLGGPTMKPVECKSYCDRDAHCVGWKFVRPGYPQGPACFLMSAVTQQVADPCCVAWTRTATTTPPPSASSASSSAAGSWQLASNCTKFGLPAAWAATLVLSEAANGAISGSVQNDPLKSSLMPDASLWGSGPSMKSLQAGNRITLVLQPHGWLSTLELTGQMTSNGSRIDGKVHHVTADDCDFGMTRTQ